VNPWIKALFLSALDKFSNLLLSILWVTLTVYTLWCRCPECCSSRNSRATHASYSLRKQASAFVVKPCVARAACAIRRALLTGTRLQYSTYITLTVLGVLYFGHGHLRVATSVTHECLGVYRYTHVRHCLLYVMISHCCIILVANIPA